VKVAVGSASPAEVIALAWPRRVELLDARCRIVGRIVDPVGETSVSVQADLPRPERPRRPAERRRDRRDRPRYNRLTFGRRGVAERRRADAQHRPASRAPASSNTRATRATPPCAPFARRHPDRPLPDRRFGFEFTPAPKQFMRLVAWMRRNEPRPAALLRGARGRRAPVADQACRPANHRSRKLLREARLPNPRPRQVHLGESGTLPPECPGLRRVLGLRAGASLYLPKDDPNVVARCQDFDRSTSSCGRISCSQRARRGARFRAGRLHDRLSRARGGERDRREREPPVFLYLAFNARTRRSRRCAAITTRSRRSRATRSAPTPR